VKTRSTGTVHTFAKAYLTSVTIQIHIWVTIFYPDPVRDLDRYQNLIICSLFH